MKKLIIITMLFMLSLSVFAQVVITPPNPKDNDDLTCSVQDKSNSQFVFRWLNGNNELAKGTILSNSLTSIDQTYTCKVYIPPSKYTGIVELGEASVIIQSGQVIPTPPTIESGTRMPDYDPVPPQP